MLRGYEMSVRDLMDMVMKVSGIIAELESAGMRVVVGDDYNEFIAGAYSRIYEEGGVRLDHLYAYLPKDGGDPLPVTFQRLLLGCVFPDGTPGLNVLAVITNQVEIDALEDENRPVLPGELIMDTITESPVKVAI